MAGPSKNDAKLVSPSPADSVADQADDHHQPEHDLDRDEVVEWEGRHLGPGCKPAPGLYLVATPIGNMGDISYRAVETLRHADLVACEDTRVTGKLMMRLGLDKHLSPYHEHNADRAQPALIAKLKAGAVVALVSDAGMPLVSDPGYRLVQACVEENINITCLPGASAVMAALALSALPNDRFMFAGFLPNKSTARRQTAREVADVPATLIFFESPNRIGESLSDLLAVLGDRPAAVARELTKLYEEVRRGTLSELAEFYANHTPKGEIVIVIGPKPAEAKPEGDDLESRIRAALLEHSVKDASALVAAETGWPKREVYAIALKLAKG